MISACKENEEYEEYEEFQILVNTKKENLRKNIYRGERERYYNAGVCIMRCRGRSIV